MTFDPSAQPGAFDSGKPVTAEDLRALRAEVWSDGSVSAREAEKLFAMNRSVEPSAEWTDFFVEALSEYLLSQGEPRGYVTEDEASWLVRQVSGDGHGVTRAELELIVKLLEHAGYAPSLLRHFALGVVEQTVLTGEGPTRAGEPVRGRIDAGEVALIRRLIFAWASDGPARVSAAEAETLFRLKDATLGKDNAPEWKKLFVQGIANHLMARQNRDSASPADEPRAERRHQSGSFDQVLAHLGGKIATRPQVRETAFGHKDDEAIARFNRAVEADAEVNSGATDWLKHLYDRDRQHDELEQALLDFLAEDGIRPL